MRETEGFGAMWSTKGHPAAAAATQVTNLLARTYCTAPPASPWAWGRGSGQASGGTGTPINMHTWKATTIIAIHHQLN